MGNLPSTRITELADRLAAGLGERFGVGPEDHPIMAEQLLERAGDDGAVNAAAYELAEAAGFDRATLEAARSRRPIQWWTVQDWLMKGSLTMVETAERPDEDRARQLARMALGGIPGSPQGFAPRHVRRATGAARRGRRDPGPL